MLKTLHFVQGITHQRIINQSINPWIPNNKCNNFLSKLKTHSRGTHRKDALQNFKPQFLCWQSLTGIPWKAHHDSEQQTTLGQHYSGNGRMWHAKYGESWHGYNLPTQRDQVNPTLHTQRNPGLCTVCLTKPLVQLASWQTDKSSVWFTASAGGRRENLAGPTADWTGTARGQIKLDVWIQVWEEMSGWRRSWKSCRHLTWCW